ncbi:MAG: hypothetical protein ACRDD1_18200, partial [Planctomycetia bacterium]
MTYRVLILTASILSPIGVAAAAPPLEYDEETTVLKPNLLAVYTDAAGAAVHMAEAVPAFVLGAGESPHPTLAPAGFQGKWTGVVKVLRRGSYRFAARVAGDLKVAVAGKTVLAG